MARWLFRTDDSIATPCSVKARTRFEYFISEDVTICDILMISSRVSVNIKSGGNLLIFLLTAWFRTLVSTPYNSAKSRSSNIFSLRRKRILLAIVSTGISFVMLSSYLWVHSLGIGLKIFLKFLERWSQFVTTSKNEFVADFSLVRDKCWLAFY